MNILFHREEYPSYASIRVDSDKVKNVNPHYKFYLVKDAAGHYLYMGLINRPFVRKLDRISMEDQHPPPRVRDHPSLEFEYDLFFKFAKSLDFDRDLINDNENWFSFCIKEGVMWPLYVTSENVNA